MRSICFASAPTALSSPPRSASQTMQSSRCLACCPWPWQPPWQPGTALHACLPIHEAARASSCCCRQLPEPKPLCRQPQCPQPCAASQACSPRVGRASTEPGALQMWPHARPEQQQHLCCHGHQRLLIPLPLSPSQPSPSSCPCTVPWQQSPAAPSHASQWHQILLHVCTGQLSSQKAAMEGRGGCASRLLHLPGVRCRCPGR